MSKEHGKRPREESVLNTAACEAYLQRLWDLDTLGMFHAPVDPAAVPNYRDVITTPVDLRTMRERLAAGHYASDAAVEEDVALMIANAIEFNPAHSEHHALARRLRGEYRALAAECGLAVDADEAYIPARRARDDEATLAAAEQRHPERYDEVVADLEKEKDIPIEELRAKYDRLKAAAAADRQSDSDSEEEEEEEEEDEEGDDGSEDESDEEDDEDDEDDDGSEDESDEEEDSDDDSDSD